MSKVYLLLALILCPLAGYSQFGLNVKYLIGQSASLDEYNISQDGIQAAIEYAFRLKDKRVEFHPAIGYRTAFPQDQFDGYFDAWDVDLATAVYPFDFGGDCDCPTFSKDGNVVKKGFFFEVIPGAGMQTLHRDQYISDPGPPQPINSTSLVFKLGLGAGLDIGVTEHLTITPLFTWTKIFPEDWEGLDNYGATAKLDDQTYLAAGLRIAYKPDERRRRY